MPKLDKFNPQDLAKAKQWIRENISDKTKLEDLPSEADIDNNNQELDPTKLPAGFKEQVKQKLREKAIELTPDTTFCGKIKKHLMKNLHEWKKYEYIISNDKKDDEVYIRALMFDEKFGKTVAKEMEPKILAATKVDTIEAYKLLDKEWGENILDSKGGIKFNAERDFFGVWNTLRGYLRAYSEEEKMERLKAETGKKTWESLMTNVEIITKD